MNSIGYQITISIKNLNLPRGRNLNKTFHVKKYNNLFSLNNIYKPKDLQDTVYIWLRPCWEKIALFFADARPQPVGLKKNVSNTIHSFLMV